MLPVGWNIGALFAGSVLSVEKEAGRTTLSPVQKAREAGGRARRDMHHFEKTLRKDLGLYFGL